MILMTLAGSQVVFAYYLDENLTQTGADATGRRLPAARALHRRITAAAHDDTVDLGDFLNVSASGSVSFDFDNLRSGNFLYVALGTESAGLMMTGRDRTCRKAEKRPARSKAPSI